jgi:hypothetical protein
MLETKQIQNLKNLKDYSDDCVQVKTYFPKNLQPFYLKIHQVDVFVSRDTDSGTGVKISEKIDLMRLAQLLCVVLHSWRPTYITVNEYCSFFH